MRERNERNNCRSSVKTVVIDATAPAVPRLDAQPAKASNQTGASFAFSSEEAGVRFTCRVDGGPPATCTSPLQLEGLAEGAHRFAVRARDASGHRSAAAVFDWVVDVTAPAAPTIDERPEPVSEGERAVVAFSASERGLEFACALDAAPPAPCSSPLELTGLESGDHTLGVVARDAAGNQSEVSTVEWTAIPEQTSLGDGAWSWFADPRAVHYHGRTYVGWVAQDGDIKLSAYDHATLIADHGARGAARRGRRSRQPALQVLPDGRVRVYYSAHGGARMWYRTACAPGGRLGVGPGADGAGEHTGGFGFTYPNPVHLAARRADVSVLARRQLQPDVLDASPTGRPWSAGARR